MINPNCVIIGGDLSAAGELITEPVLESIRRYAITSAAEQVSVVAGVLGERAELLGALALVLHATTASSARARPPRWRHEAVWNPRQRERNSLTVEVVRVTRSKSWARGAVLAFAALVIGLGLAACGGGGGGGGPKVALLLPESKTTRYEAHDHPEFEAALKDACSDCDLIYNNANQDASTQQSQMESALTDGADVVVLDPVDSASAASMVQLAKQQNVPVVSYDRLILDTPDVAAYVSFDNVKVGELQGSTLAKKLADDGNANGPIIRINGSPTDNNATLFGQGASKELDAAGVQVAKEYDTPDWSPDKAQSEMDQAITAVGKTGFKGLYAMNDGTAGGAIAAMQAAGIDPKTIPSTGQDAELEAVQRILTGDQFMTVYKATQAGG